VGEYDQWSRSSLAEIACKTLAAVLWEASAQAFPRIRGEQLVWLGPHLCGPRRNRQSIGRMCRIKRISIFCFCQITLSPSRITALPLGVSSVGSRKARLFDSSLHSPLDKRVCTSVGMLSNRCLTCGLLKNLIAGAVALPSRRQRISYSPPRR
jgi:hypothetical protein